MCEPATMAILVGTAASATTGAAATAGILGTAGALTAGGAMSALSAASAVAGLAGQVSASNSMAESSQQQARNLMLSRAQNANQINLERVQSTDAAGQKINANNTALREAQATTVARAGPSGLSVDALLANLGTRGANYNQSVTENLDRTNLALDNQLQNVNTQTSSNFNQMKTGTVPDYLGAGLKIANTGYDSYQKNKAVLPR